VPKAELVADEVLVKPAREGAEITWHQDWVVNPDFPDDYLTFWIPLDDVLDDDRGPVEFVIGSHRLGRFLPAEFAVAPVPHPGLMELERLGMPILPVPEESGLPTEVLRVPAGACSVHHSSIWHRSLPNKSDQPRLALAQRYRVPPVHIEKETVAP
jgi:ectoine hydroxylase-related dioxygenase (phytanoyl-CoA dioxygenase family)